MEPASEEHADLNAATHQISAHPFLSGLKVYNGTFSDENIWKIFMRPFMLILSPVVRVLAHIRRSVSHILI